MARKKRDFDDFSFFFVLFWQTFSSILCVQKHEGCMRLSKLAAWRRSLSRNIDKNLRALTLLPLRVDIINLPAEQIEMYGSVRNGWNRQVCRFSVDFVSSHFTWIASRRISEIPCSQYSEYWEQGISELPRLASHVHCELTKYTENGLRPAYSNFPYISKARRCFWATITLTPIQALEMRQSTNTGAQTPTA